MGVFRELGKAVASRGKAVEHIGKGAGKVLAGIGGAIDTLGSDLVDAQRTRHETVRLREQHVYLSQHKRDKAQIVEAAKHADHLRDREVTEQQARIRAGYRDLQHQHRLENRTHKVHTKVLQIEALDQVKRKLANSPFQYDGERLAGDARRVSADGDRPVLLIAPFVGDPDADGLAGEVARATDQLGRPDAMGRLAGAFRRSLDLADTDVNTIREALGGIPTILVNGEFDGNGQVWVTVTGWDLIGPGEGGDARMRYRIHRTALPPVEIPTGRFADRKRREVRRNVAVAAVFLAALYAEWFHVARGELPELYADLPQGLRGDVAVGSAAMLEVAAARDLIQPVDAALAQAGVYLDVGLDERARELLDRAVAMLLDDAGAEDKLVFLDRVRRAKVLLVRAGLATAAERLDRRAEPVAGDEILSRSPWGK